MSYYQVKAGVQKPQHFERKRKAGTSQRQRLRLCRCEDTPRQQRPTQGISAGTRSARPALRIYRLLRCPPLVAGSSAPTRGALLARSPGPSGARGLPGASPPSAHKGALRGHPSQSPCACLRAPQGICGVAAGAAAAAPFSALRASPQPWPARRAWAVCVGLLGLSWARRLPPSAACPLAAAAPSPLAPVRPPSPPVPARRLLPPRRGAARS